MTARVRLAIRSGRPKAGALLLALLLGACALLPSLQAQAEESKPALQVLEVGWDGHSTAGAWAPVRVKVTGAARDLDALVEVTLENPYQTGPTTTLRIPMAAYAQEVSLPANAAKEVTLWVPTGHGMLGSVRLKAGEEELARESIEFRITKAPYWPLVGVLSDQEGLLAPLKRITLPLQNLPTEINVALLKAEGLPTLPDRLKGLRAIVVQGNAPAALTEGQRKAIAKWVENGGHLLLAGGPDLALTAAALPAGLLPVTFGGAEMGQDLSALGPWAGTGAAALRGPVVRLTATGGTTLAGTTERPLAWRMGHGQGSITLLTVDPTLEPLASYAGLPQLLKTALSPALWEESMGTVDQKIQMMNMEQDMAYRLRGNIDALPNGAYPGWKEVALYLGGFALLAGPVIHLFFWQGRRRGWLWLAVPAASVLVAGGIYLGGITTGGRDLMGHTLSHLQIDPATQTASQRMMVGLYAPMHKDLTVSVEADASINAMGMLEGAGWGPRGPRADVEGRPPFRVVNGSETRMEFYGNEWMMRPLALSRTLGKETGRISSQLRLEGNLITGTITNETPYRLENAAVAVGGTAKRLGEIAPGQTVELSLEPAEVNPMHYMSYGMLFFGEPLPAERLEQIRKNGGLPPGAPEPLEMPTEPEAQRRMRMLETLLYRPMPGGENPALPLTLVAFTQDAVGPRVVDLTGHPDHHLHLIEQRLELSLPAGTFQLPPGLIPSQTAMWNTRGMGSGSDGKSVWVEFDYGTITYTFTPPLPKGAEVTALEITTQTMGQVQQGSLGQAPPPPDMTPQAAQPGIFQIYNFRAAAWENLPAGQESARLTNPAPYLGPESQVQVRVDSGNNQIVRYAVPKLIMEGRGQP